MANTSVTTADQLNAAADGMASKVTHLAIVDTSQAQIGDRQPVTWAAATGGVANIAADTPFSVGADVTVGGWRGYDAATGGTSYGGVDYDASSQEQYTNAGTYTLSAASTGYSAN